MAKVYIERDTSDHNGWFVRIENGKYKTGRAIYYCTTKFGAIRMAKRYIKYRNQEPKRIDIGEINEG